MIHTTPAERQTRGARTHEGMISRARAPERQLCYYFSG